MPCSGMICIKFPGQYLAHYFSKEQLHLKKYRRQIYNIVTVALMCHCRVHLPTQPWSFPPAWTEGTGRYTLPSSFQPFMTQLL
jgi:hypothetical protein